MNTITKTYNVVYRTEVVDCNTGTKFIVISTANQTRDDFEKNLFDEYGNFCNWKTITHHVVTSSSLSLAKKTKPVPFANHYRSRATGKFCNRKTALVELLARLRARAIRLDEFMQQNEHKLTLDDFLTVAEEYVYINTKSLELSQLVNSL